MIWIIKFLALIYLNLNLVNGLNLTTSCGRSHSTSVNPDWRIVGGTNTVSGEFPWQIMLTRSFYNEQGQHMMELCGGTIINERWMLTAAHCVAKSSVASEYLVQLGVHNTQAAEGTERKASVEKVIHHELFSQATVTNDIALVKIQGTIDFKVKHNFLEPVCLANSSMQLPTTCIATGFGYRSAQGSAAQILQKVSEPIVENSQCTRVHKFFNSQQNICAGGKSFGGTGTCMGDSGGPLQCKGSDGRFYQVGITSYGIPCARPNDPDVFTSVAAYVSWIEKTIANN